MSDISIITNLVTGVIVFVLCAFFIIPVVIDLWQINNNEEKYGDSLTNYDLKKKNECRSFCGADNVRYVPSTLFKQDVCQCEPQEPR